MCVQLFQQYHSQQAITLWEKETVQLKCDWLRIMYCASFAAVCPTLGNPANGMVSLTGTSIGDTATYTCNEGHEFVGAPVLNCQSNGMWDNSPPVCKREFIP